MFFENLIFYVNTTILKQPVPQSQYWLFVFYLVLCSYFKLPNITRILILPLPCFSCCSTRAREFFKVVDFNGLPCTIIQLFHSKVKCYVSIKFFRVKCNRHNGAITINRGRTNAFELKIFNTCFFLSSHQSACFSRAFWSELSGCFAIAL